MIIVTHDPELRVIADRMYYIRDGNISHQFSKEEMEKMKTNYNNTSTSINNISQNGGNYEEFLIELREIDHMVKAKINKIEKKIHPI